MPLLLLALLLLTINSTFLNPSFYVEQLRQANVYSFLYDKALPALLEDASKESELPLNIDLAAAKVELVSAARQVLPPDWLQAQVEQAINKVLPYALGEKDEFAVTIPLADRMEEAGRTAKRLLREGKLFDQIYQGLTAEAADDLSKNLDSLPFGLTATKQDILDAIGKVAPKDWLLDKMDDAVDQVVPYFSGRAQNFSVTLALADRVEPASAVLKDLVRKGKTREFLLQQVINPAIEANLGGGLELALGVRLTSQEAKNAVAEVITEEWVQSRLNDVLDTGVAYLTGRTNTLAIRVPFADRKEAATTVLARLGDRKLTALYDGLPQCPAGQPLSAALGPGVIPLCKPVGVTFEQLKTAFDIDVTREIRKALIGQIPDELVYTDKSLKDALGQEGFQQVDRVRTWLVQGLTFTDADLRKLLEKENPGLLDDILETTRQGFTFTHEDLQKATQEGGNSLDQVRQTLSTARRWLFLAWLVPLLTVGLIGLLGGRNWGSKLAWAAGTLAIASTIAFVASGPVYEAAAKPQLDAALDRAVTDALEEDGAGGGAFAKVMAPKMTEMVTRVADSFIAGIRGRALVLLLVAGLGLGGGITWQVLRRHRTKPPVVPSGP